MTTTTQPSDLIRESELGTIREEIFSYADLAAMTDGNGTYAEFQTMGGRYGVFALESLSGCIVTTVGIAGPPRAMDSSRMTPVWFFERNMALPMGEGFHQTFVHASLFALRMVALEIEQELTA